MGGWRVPGSAGRRRVEFVRNLMEWRPAQLPVMFTNSESSWSRHQNLKSRHPRTVDLAANSIGDSSSGSPLFNLSVESCNEYKSKTDKIREAVEQVTSDDSKKRITKLLAEVQQLSDVEKLLLYLRLPSGSKCEVDPLKQSIVSSLGNRYEVTQTVTWIQTHLEEDSDVSLPKQDVYKDYINYCERETMKPLSTADFGKVMKQVFPNVRPRRLGTRGNSRYCYAGLRARFWLDTPRLPDLTSPHEEPSEEIDCDDQEVNGPISSLIREWAEKVLERKFVNLRELAFYVAEKGYAKGNTVATFTMLSCAATSGVNGKGSQSNPVCDVGKHRETRIQLQRKIHERESIREQKKRLVEQKCQSDKTSHSVSSSATTSVNLPKVSPRKTSNSKSQTQETLRRLLSTENGSEPKRKHSEESCWSSSDGGSTTHKLENVTELSCSEKSSASGEITYKSSPVYRRQSSNAAKSGVDSQQGGSRFEPVRRKSGGDSRSPRPSPLLSGWGTPTSDITSVVPTCSKSGKVMIPRVTTRSSSSNGTSNGEANNSGSKLCLASTNIIIIPSISTTIPSTEFNNGGGGSTCVTPTATTSNGSGSNGITCQKSKYKLIQPKPCNLTDDKNGLDKTNENEGDKEAETISRSSRRSSSSSLKRISDDKDDRESLKATKNRKRTRQPSESDKQKMKRHCGQSQMQQKVKPEDEKSTIKCLEDANNDMSQGEIIKNLEQDALIEYLTNSVDHEVELNYYYRNGDEENNPTEACEIKNENCEAEIDMEQHNEVDISQLRQILEENFRHNALGTSYSTNEEQESIGRREASAMPWNSSAGINYNDRSSVLRSLLGDQRKTSSSESHNGMKNNETSSIAKNSLTSCGLTNHSHVMDACASASSWRHGDSDDLYLSAVAKTSDEMLMSSDSSSGCFPHIPGGAFMPLEEGMFERTHEHSVNQHQQQLESGNQLNSDVYTGHVLSYPQLGNSHGNSSVPPSPNTRRRAFNFQPISPQNTVQEAHSRTQSPLPYLMSGGTILPSRVNSGAGSFVSPISTPGSLSRSRHNSGQAINTGSSSSAVGTPRATPYHVITDQSTCLHSSFVSPHPTPVPFSRSRHNSSQQQSQQQSRYGNSSSVPCTPTASRSRHSSERVIGTPASGSAPVSPLEVQQQQQSHSSVAHYSEAVAAESHYSNNSRSRHNSSSGYAPLSLPPPQQPHTLLNGPLSNSTSLVPQSLPQHLTMTSETSENVNLIRSYPVNDWQTHEWSNRQVDPRLLARHRHASVDSHFVQFQNNCPAALSSTHPELGLQIVMNSNTQQEVAQQVIRKSEQSNLQMVHSGVANRSRSVPLYQMLNHASQQAEQLDQPIRDVMMSHSYPATPTGQSTTFTFDGNSVSDCHSGATIEGSGGESNDLELGLNDFQTIDEADKELEEVDRQVKSNHFQQHSEDQSAAVSVNVGDNLSATLDLPMDQYQNIIPPCAIDDYMLSEFHAVDLGLESCYSATSTASIQH
ncbi:hypothetical protein CHUAL_010276 [Chamberlinius hualienensis]